MSASGAVLTRRQRWSRERIVDAMRMFHEEHGYPPRAGDWRGALPTYPDPGTVSRHFGSWAQAIQAAGFQVRRIEWSDEQLLAAIRAWTRRHGAPPNTTSWAKRDPAGRWPSAATVQLRFGTWEAALLAAGVRVDRIAWDRENVLAAIAAFAEQHGRPPRRAELRKANKLPDHSTVVHYCGSVSYTHLRAHETGRNLVCRLLLEKKKKKNQTATYLSKITEKKKKLTHTPNEY